jgi:hypothetical protein
LFVHFTMTDHHALSLRIISTLDIGKKSEDLKKFLIRTGQPIDRQSSRRGPKPTIRTGADGITSLEFEGCGHLTWENLDSSNGRGSGGLLRMNRKPVRRYMPAQVCLLFLSVCVPLAALGKKQQKKGGDFDLSDIIRPELINAPASPTLRYPVMPGGSSVFGITYGWLDISNSTIRYTEVQPKNKSSRSFEVSRLGISDIRLNNGWVSFRSSDERQEFSYLPQDRWGSVHTGPGMSSMANRESLGTSSIYKTLLNFDRVMALVNPDAGITQPVAQVQAPKVGGGTSPPAIVLSSPAGAVEGHPVDWQDPTIVIRGVAMDSTGIPAVKVNGMAANMRPQTAQAAEFWSDPITLQLGANSIRIVAANSARLEGKLLLTINYQPKSPEANTRGLAKSEIISLLQGGVPPAHVTDLIRQRGIKFSPTAADVSEIRSAGGTAELIQAIRQSAQ